MFEVSGDFKTPVLYYYLSFSKILVDLIQHTFSYCILQTVWFQFLIKDTAIFECHQ